MDHPAPARRLGLALSGGGFRASFFHVGVLAQMARLGMLRHLEVLSTVSGGSVIGALYYLHLKRLLEERPDAAVTDQDYRDLVRRLETTFFEAVRRNLRVRSFLNPWAMIRTCLPTFSRSDYVGYLYDHYFYRPAFGAGRARPVEMRELRVRPKGGPADFRPLRHNAGRAAKVPILLVNATTLNTGHNWRFEAVRMGEPQRSTPLAREVDKVVRLRRPTSYDDVTPRQQDLELGLAVAASSGVPGLFPPLAVSGLYDQGFRVQLVDGGVHDNQGIQGLLDLECTHFVVSDATGQLRAEKDSAAQLLPLLYRSADVLVTRLREEELFRLMERDERRVALLHLRKGLSAEAVAWLDRDGKPAEGPKEERLPRVTFGVPEEVQEALSHVRTDLDAFTEVEAYSLMLDAYLMSEVELPRLEAFAAAPAADEECRWRFRHVEPWLRNPTPRYLRRLRVARERLFRLFRLKWPITLLLLVALLAGLGWLAWTFLTWERLREWLAVPVPVGVLLAVFAALGLLALPELVNVARVPAWLRLPVRVVGRLAVRAVAAPVIAAAAAVQLWLIDPLFQREGRLDRLGPPARR